MKKSNLLKEAIADAKAVRETAIANAKVALEEAFTPRLQSILSQKLQQEIDGEEEDVELEEEYGSEDAPTGDSSSIGAGASADSGTNGKQPSGVTTKPHTELGDTDKESSAIGSELEASTVVREGEGQDEDGDGVIDDPTGASVTEDEDFGGEQAPEFGSEEEESDEDLDLESIIRELEDEFGSDDEEGGEEEFEAEAEPMEAEPEMGMEPEVDDFGGEAEFEAEPEVEESGEQFSNGEDAMGNEPEAEFGDDEDVDLDEILREMGYGDDEEAGEEAGGAEEFAAQGEELEEAYNVIRSLKGTINEVNLLNAKLLYSNKLFRGYDMTNEQKMKVIETLDRTNSVREVKLVFATLAESMKFGNATRKRSTKITESFASKTVASTAPKKEIIAESNDMAERFQKLANIKVVNG